MAKKPPVKVKVRKWVTCAEPGGGRRAGTSKPYCGEHQKKWDKKHVAAQKADAAAKRKRKADPKKHPISKDVAFGKADRVIEAARSAELVRKRSKKEQAAAAARRAASPSSRLIKAHCEKCDYTIRLSRKWIEIRRPMCPVCVKNMVTELDGTTEADPRQLPLKKIKKAKKKRSV